HLPLVKQREAQAVVSVGILGVGSDGLLVAGDGLLHLPLAIQDDAQVVAAGSRCRPAARPPGTAAATSPRDPPAVAASASPRPGRRSGHPALPPAPGAAAPPPPLPPVQA